MHSWYQHPVFWQLLYTWMPEDSRVRYMDTSTKLKADGLWWAVEAVQSQRKLLTPEYSSDGRACLHHLQAVTLENNLQHTPSSSDGLPGRSPWHDSVESSLSLCGSKHCQPIAQMHTSCLCPRSWTWITLRMKFIAVNKLSDMFCLV